MGHVAKVSEQLKAEALEADALHERSRKILLSAVRSGSAAGLSQREIAVAIGRSQPEVSRLLRFHGTSELGRKLMRERVTIKELAAAHGATNLRVFGSVVRGTNGPGSDVDLLADIAPGTTLFDLARLERDLGNILDATVDLVPANGLRPHLSQQVLAEAMPL